MNQQQKQIMQLQKRSRERRKEHVFIIEGTKMFAEIPKERLRRTIVSESFLKERAAKRLLDGISFETVPDSVFEALSDTKTPQGILAVVEQYDYQLKDLFPADKNALILVLETVQDPGNLGTMFRAGEAAGVTGFLMNAATADIYNPKTVRATMGTIFRMPFVITEDLPASMEELKKRNVTSYAAHLSGTGSYEEFPYRKNTAFLIGNEANGLSDSITALADKKIRIPMEGKVESLNAAMAATVLMFEAARQRRHA